MRRLGLDLLRQTDLPATMPQYDPRDHRAGVVHLGVGNFHRAHQALYLDDVLAQRGGDWRVTGVSLRSPDVHERLAAQDYLYSVLEGEGQPPRIVAALANVLHAPANPAAVIDAIADPGVHLVTLTVTEKGYCVVPGTTSLDLEHPDIVRDLANPERPFSALGYLVEGLARRIARGASLPTIMSCDNLRSNGAVLRELLIQHARLRSQPLAALLERDLCCPATMVDRMVPAVADAEMEGFAALAGYRDRGLIRTEPFRQWVVEDGFAGPMPALDQVGVELVDDVTPFELSKLRLLNGSHSFLAYVGLSMGFTYVHEAISDPAMLAGVRRLMRSELGPSLAPHGKLDLDDYAEILIARFGNPTLRHALAQIGTDGTQKIPVRWLEALAVQISTDGPIRLIALGLAAWLVLWVRSSGMSAMTDPRSAELVELGHSAMDMPGLVDSFLALPDLFTVEVSASERFRAELLSALSELMAGTGTEAAAAALRARIR